MLGARHPMRDSSSCECHDGKEGEEWRGGRRDEEIRYVEIVWVLLQRCHNSGCTAWQPRHASFPSSYTQSLLSCLSLKRALLFSLSLFLSLLLFLPPVLSGSDLFLPLTHPVKSLAERDSRLQMPRKAQSVADCAPVHLVLPRPVLPAPICQVCYDRFLYLAPPFLPFINWRCVDGAGSDRS